MRGRYAIEIKELRVAMKIKKQYQPASGLTLLGALITGVAAAQNADAPPAPPAQTPAAEAQPAVAPGDETTEVTITGSRIRMPSGLTTSTPVTVISNIELSNMSPTSLVDALDAVPSFFNNVNASTSFSSNVPAAQGTNVNLRGLGPNRTLTLLSGRRVVPGSKIGTVNIANFPSAAIDRVDVVTGGASAVYGTDAVAGVTNFVLNTGFTGFKGNVQGGISSRADNENGKMELTFGTPIGDNMHLILSGEISQEEGIDDPESRGWYQRWGTILNKQFADTGVGPRRIRAREVVSVNWTCGGLILQPGSALNRLQFNPDGTSSPFVFANNYVPGDTVQSLAAGTGGASGGCRDYQFPDAGPQLTNTVGMKNAFGYLDYKVGENAKVYFQVIHGDSAVTTSGGSGLLEAPWQMTIFRDNAFLPANIAAIMDTEGRTSFTMHRNFAEIMTDQALDIDNVNLSLTTGFDWNLHTDGFLDGWQVQGYYQYGRNKQHNGLIGYIRTQTLNVAIDSVRDPATGKIVCHAALTNPLFKDCIPYNVFGEGNASGEAERYITTPADGQIDHFFINREDVAELSMNGQIAKGWGAGPISGAFGVDYRKESIDSYQTGLSAEFDTPTNTTPGVRGVPSGYAGDPDVQLFGSFADVDGEFDVKEAFVESLVPIVSGLPLIKQINFTPAARWASYSGSGSIWAYKGGLDWDLNSQFRVRSTYSRDVRAATLAERFDQQRASGAVTDDPVAGGSYRFSQTNGGNPAVAPEKADTFTAGIVYQPSWLEGFTMTLDWWDIKIAGAIGRLATQDIIVRCFQGATSLCPLITRDPTTQQITDVQNVYININEERARGLDLELHYTRNLDDTFFDLFKGAPESVTFGFLGTQLKERSTLIPGAPKFDAVGEIPPGGDIRQSAYPEFVFNANVTYNVGNFSARVQTRFYDGGVTDKDLIEGVDIDDNSVDSSYWTDLRLTYHRDNWEVFGHIINLFDQAPPISPQLAAQGNTQFYDTKGQRFVIGARWQFK
jgi:outer membrane receptor protein involved in Fe transport